MFYAFELCELARAAHTRIHFTPLRFTRAFALLSLPLDARVNHKLQRNLFYDSYTRTLCRRPFARIQTKRRLGMLTLLAAIRASERIEWIESFCQQPNSRIMSDIIHR